MQYIKEKVENIVAYVRIAVISIIAVIWLQGYLAISVFISFKTYVLWWIALLSLLYLTATFKKVYISFQYKGKWDAIVRNWKNFRNSVVVSGESFVMINEPEKITNKEESEWEIIETPEEPLMEEFEQGMVEKGEENDNDWVNLGEAS
jgi:hypothetical protein